MTVFAFVLRNAVPLFVMSFFCSYLNEKFLVLLVHLGFILEDAFAAWFISCTCTWFRNVNGHPTIIMSDRVFLSRRVCLMCESMLIGTEALLYMQPFNHISILICSMSQAALISHTVAQPFLFTMLCQYYVTLLTRWCEM